MCIKWISVALLFCFVGCQRAEPKPIAAAKPAVVEDSQQDKDSREAAEKLKWLDELDRVQKEAERTAKIESIQRRWDAATHESYLKQLRDLVQQVADRKITEADRKEKMKQIEDDILSGRFK